jgi:NAD(P)H-dependent FMN reductase
MSAPKIALICASLRKDSINKKLELALEKRLKADGAEPVRIDLGEYDLPLYHGDLELPDGVKRLVTDLTACDGVIVVTPEYNGGLPPLLKNAIDWTSTFSTDHFTGPVWGLASCTPGPMSGIMCMRQLNYILMRVGTEVVPTQVGVGNAASAFDEDGHLVAEPSSGLAEKMMASLFLRIKQKAAIK